MGIEHMAEQRSAQDSARVEPIVERRSVAKGALDRARGGVDLGAGEGAKDGFRGAANGDWARFSAQETARLEKARIGWTTALLLAFAAAVGAVSWWSAHAGAPEIAAPAGFAVFAGAGVGLLALALGPELLDGGGLLAGLAAATGRALYFILSTPFLALDVVLRRVVAETCALRVRSAPVRYVMLMLHIGAAAAAVWVVPSVRPELSWIGYAGVAWAGLVALAIVRQWTWVDRQYETLSPALMDTEELRLPDLRDEAAIAALLLLGLAPVTLWRLDQTFDLFASAGATLLDWAAFFGAEIAKAALIVDWTGAFGVRAVTGIEPLPPYGPYAVLALRAAIDTALLAGLLLVLASARRADRQWTEFLAGARTLVEPKLERRILRLLRQLATKSDGGGSWLETASPADLGPFKRYDPRRLRLLARDADPEYAAIAAHAAFAQSPKDAFMPIARDVFDDDRRSRAAAPKTVTLLVDLLGCTSEPLARKLLETILVAFEGKSQETTARVRSRAAINLTTAWRIAAAGRKGETLEEEIVGRLRYGLQRNRDGDAQVRKTIGDQLSTVGGTAALAALAGHLEHETSSETLANFAGDMQRMASRAPEDALKSAAELARKRAAAINARNRRSDADKVAARALIQAADAMDKAIREAKEGPQPEMILVQPVFERA